MVEEPLTNSLSIYLIKDEITDSSEIVSSDHVQSFDISQGKIYAARSIPQPPKWLYKFFPGQENLSSDLGLVTSSAKAVYIITDVGDNNRTFAVCFGYGKHLLQKGVIEDRFGLITTLNLVDPQNLRSIDKTSLESVPKHSHEQISQDGDKDSFGVNIEQDLVRAVAGKVKSGYENFGKIVYGKDALYITTKVDTTNINQFLSDCLERYESNDYKTDFEWIDQIAELRDKTRVIELETKIEELIIEEHTTKIWMATPEEIDWSRVQGFKYRNSRSNLHEDISLRDYLESLEGKEPSLKKLRNDKIFGISSETEDILYSWSAYNCIYAEIEENGKTYLLTNGKWYEIDENFVDRINTDFHSITKYSENFPEYTNAYQNENNYNEAVASEIDAVCLDRKNISYGGGRSKIEFCDLLLNDNSMAHVKHYSGSSTLSHLFAQGAVAGEIYLSEAGFRREVNSLLPEPKRLRNPDERYQPNGRKLIYAIISRSEGELDLPFFSKVSLRNAKRRLEGWGYSVQLAKITNSSNMIRNEA